jgi:hypothetical protein
VEVIAEQIDTPRKLHVKCAERVIPTDTCKQIQEFAKTAPYPVQVSSLK